MLFSSTSKIFKDIKLKEAVLNGLAPDKTLYLPNHIERLPEIFFKEFIEFSMSDISKSILHNFFKDDLDHHCIEKISNESFNFDIPLISLENNISVLELFHGPTLAFKDVGARFMASLFDSINENKKTIILTATSGDTGSAVAHAFLKKENIKVVILYPKGKVSNVQEKQFTTLGKNITAVEVKGTFDDCQKLVKNSFENKNLKDQCNLTSANSINIARLLPQSFYYFKGYANAVKLGIINNGDQITFSVPSGNFGNLTGGIFAKEMGLPINFIASTNINKAFYNYIKEGKYNPKKSVPTISSAMDVGNPSNYERLVHIFSKKHNTHKDNEIIQHITQCINTEYFSDEETAKNIVSTWKKNNYLVDPHTSVGVLGAKKFSTSNPTIVLSTAHPAKFPETVQESFQKYGNTNNFKIETPERLEKLMNKEKITTEIETNLKELENLIRDLL